MTTTAGRVYGGLRPGTTTDSLRVAVSNGALADHLACFAPKPGDAILLPAGTVHAVGGSAVVFEVSENSDVTFRLYDWDHVDAGTGQPRAVQVDQAIDCTNFARGALGLAAPVVEETTPMSCSCRRLSVRARSGPSTETTLLEVGLPGPATEERSEGT